MEDAYIIAFLEQKEPILLRQSESARNFWFEKAYTFGSMICVDCSGLENQHGERYNNVDTQTDIFFLKLKSSPRTYKRLRTCIYLLVLYT